MRFVRMTWGGCQIPDFLVTQRECARVVDVLDTCCCSLSLVAVAVVACRYRFLTQLGKLDKHSLPHSTSRICRMDAVTETLTGLTVQVLGPIVGFLESLSWMGVLTHVVKVPMLDEALMPIADGLAMDLTLIKVSDGGGGWW
jgi:hypothetical protein